MKAALLALVSDIPRGKVAQVGDVGLALNIPPRYVAYILSQLSEDEAAFVPWHRVVPVRGKFPAVAKQTERHIRQIELLALEGIRLGSDAIVASVQSHLTALPTKHQATFWADEG